MIIVTTAPRLRFSALQLAMILFGTIAASFVLGWLVQASATSKQVLRLAAGGAVVRMQQGTDSLQPMEEAYAAARATPHVNIYLEVIRRSGRRFQYSAASLLPLHLWATAGRFLPGISSRTAFLFLSILSLVLMALATAYLGISTGPPGTLRDKGLLAAALACLAAVYYPLLRGFHLGQLQVILNAEIAVLCILWELDLAAPAGVIAGLLCICKPQYALLALWSLAGRRYRFAGWMAATAGICILWSLLVFGVSPYIDYVHFLTGASRGHSYWGNQSANGFFNRLANHEPWFIASPVSFAPANAGVVAAAGILSVALIGVCFLRVWRAKNAPGLIDLGIALLTLTIASPIAWDHHYGFLPVLFAVAFVTARKPIMLAGTITAYLLTADLWIRSDSQTVLNDFVVSATWIGALLLLFILYRYPVGSIPGTRSVPAPQL